GSGVRFSDAGKALAPLASRPVLAWSLSLFAALTDVVQVVVVAGQHTQSGCETLLEELDHHGVSVVCGGATRADSVRAGIASLHAACTHVAIHDAARPLVTEALVRRVIDAALAHGAAIPVVPVGDTLHVVSSDGTIASTPDRASLRAAQTPQVARRDWLEHAYQIATGTTDEGGLLHAAGYPVMLVDGDPANLKITWPADLALAEALLAVREGSR
ncbi:MAG TPA: 2-C-methyl-D-erythritol 4-phosphate cytidylyltransferase, partial [Thermomicrobiales bacterium]|nr:2-C-methyl-D-erythritol 4-phosphate cytidylyltransferase [Thermomicrobiales bacterium]